jgi:hypothetical protein
MNDSSLTLDQMITDGLVKLVYRLVRCYTDNSPNETIFETHSKRLADLSLFECSKLTSTNDDYWYEVHETMTWVTAAV